MKTRNVTVWSRISNALAAEIERGTLRGGERLPTDIELGQRFGCNKHTARRAVADLEQRGLVRVEWGRGTFVVDRSADGKPTAQAQFVHSLLDQQGSHLRRVLRSELLPADAVVARALRIAVGSSCLRLVMLNESSDVPFSLAVNYFPVRRLPHLSATLEKLAGDDAQLTSIKDLLRSSHVKVRQRSRIKISARLPSAEEASHLRIARQQPLLETETVEIDDEGRPVTYSKTCFRADRLQFVVPSS
jgi:GntR family transcriptional regulator, phosphonate transport system regulatory protein